MPQFELDKVNIGKVLSNLSQSILDILNLEYTDPRVQDSSLIDLGLDSIRAIEIQHLIEIHAGVEIAIVDILETEKIPSLLHLIRVSMEEGTDWCRDSITIAESTSDTTAIASRGQHRIYFLTKIPGWETTYNECECIRITGALNRNLFEACFQRINRRHEILRTTFYSKGGILYQRVHEESNALFEFKDITEYDENAQKKLVKKLTRSISNKPIDLENGSLQFIFLFKISEDQYRLCIIIHHIICDGWSIPVFLKEISTLYHANMNKLSTAFTPLPIQYKDFAIWEESLLTSPRSVENANYWVEKLTPPALPLDLFHPKNINPSETSEALVKNFRLSFDDMEKIIAINHKSGCTMFVTLLSALQVLLSLYSDSDDIVVGCPIANRNNPQLSDLIGLFTISLPFRAILSDDATFAEIQQQVRQTTINNIAHSDVSIETLNRELRQPRSLQSSPLFQVFFQLEQDKSFEFNDGALKMARELPAPQSAKFDLSLFLLQQSDGISGAFIFRKDAVFQEIENNIVRDFDKLITRLIANPTIRLSTLRKQFKLSRRIPTQSHTAVGDKQKLTRGERNRILDLSDPPRRKNQAGLTVLELFDAQVKRIPKTMAITFQNKKISYENLNKKSDALAYYLRSKGVGKGMPVAICIDRSEDLVVAVLGVLKAGAPYIPIDTQAPKNRIRNMLNDAGVEYVLTQESRSKQFTDFGISFYCLDGEIPVTTSRQPPLENVTGNDLAYIIYTSGSTGKPKGVAIKHSNLLNAFHGWQDVYGLGSQSSSHLQMARFTFDVFTADWVRALCSGGMLTICPENYLLSPEKLYDIILNEDVDIAEFVPTTLRILMSYLENSKLRLDFMHVLIVGSDVWYVEDHRRLQKLCAPETRIINSYGLTECTIDSTYFDGDVSHLKAQDPVPIGIPFRNVQTYIVNDAGQLMPFGVDGELCIAGDGLGLGYIKSSDHRYAEIALDDGYESKNISVFRTGDRARMHPEYGIQLAGRMDRQVKLRGYRVELGEIEGVLRSNPIIEDAVVILQEKEAKGIRLVAYLTTKNEFISVSETRKQLEKQLPIYMIPSVFVRLEKIPTTRNGKINYAVLPSLDKDLIEAERKYLAPRTPEEKVLARIWEELLPYTTIGINDNFFDMGGDSILSLQAAALASEEGLTIEPVDIFEHQTIAELSRFASFRGQRSDESETPPTGSMSLTPIQARFFSKKLKNPNYFNQAILLETDPHLSPDAIETVMETIVTHHDALRMRFLVTDEGVLQEYEDDLQLNFFERVDISEYDPDTQREILQEKINEFHQSLDLEKGPLLRIVYFDFGGDKSNRLAIIIHHLAIDGISWRILLRDIQIGFKQYESSPTIQFPPRSASFQEWARSNEKFAQSTKAIDDLDYWLQYEDLQVPDLPTDMAPVNFENTAAVSDSVSVELKLSTFLKDRQLANNKITTNDVLLAALLLTLYEWDGRNSLYLDLEGHGREHSIGALDLGRTVGWFTSLFPVLISVDEQLSPQTALEATHEQLQKIPSKGVSFAALRYLSSDQQIRTRLANLPQPQISFNYMGQFDQAWSQNSPFSPAPESPGPFCSPKEERVYLLNINGLTLNGKLTFEWSYNRKIHKKSTIEKIANNFLENIESLSILEET